MMKNKTKEPTAVQWLIEHLNLDKTSPNYNQYTIDKALEMEANQHYELIVKSYKEGSDYTINLMEKIAREKLEGM